jgi:hypothetical protein
LDYPYPRNEFGLPSKMPRLCKQDAALDITPWAEETDGRRKFQVYQRLSPISDVDTPPRSPIAANQIHPDTIPHVPDPAAGNDVWRIIPNEDDEDLECCFVYSEKTARPEDTKPTKVDLRCIDPPNEQIITESCVPIYSDRL